MGAERWHTLCALASFMNAEGECYPAQDTIARRLGVNRQSANARIGKLLRYRWRGKPVLISRKERGGNGQWTNAVYTILPESNLAIFGNHDGSAVYSEQDTVIADTNDIQF
jgi:hypothetical protein